MRLFIALLATVLTTARVTAQDPPPFELPGFPGLPGGMARSFADVAEFSATIEPAQAKPGQLVTFKLTVIPKPGCWTYPTNPPTGQFSRNDIELPRIDDLIFVRPVEDPKGWKEKPAAEPGKIDRVYYDPVTWDIKAIVSPKATSGKKSIALMGTQLQACNSSACFPTDLNNPPSASLEILAGSVPVPEEYRDLVEQSGSGGKPATEPKQPTSPGVIAATIPSEQLEGILQRKPITPAVHKAQLDQLRSRLETGGATAAAVQGGFSGLIFAALFWGFISLVTPCVFPMIPITVSLFLKQSHQSTAGAIKLAVIYCLTIIAVLGASAIFLLSIFRDLSVDPFMNLFLGALFVFFALSLFGMYDITLPGFLLRFTEKRRGAGGIFGTVFGALAFSIVSFTCVAPFLGGFAGMAASGGYSQFELILAGIAFAAAFASPFFLLALFPSLIKSLPRSGGWLDSVKVVMGFLELAAALKFFRTAELRLLDRPAYFTYDMVLAGWVAISVATALYLLNLYRLPHDEEKPNVGVFRLLIALTFLVLGVYLAPALLKNQRPGGAIYAWVDAFLLPEPAEAGGEELPWGTDLVSAVNAVVKEKQTTGKAEKPYIFVDFTGVTCTNCKLNEKNIFPQPKVHELLSQYRLVQMYTDEVPVAFYTEAPERLTRKQEAAGNLAFQREVFGTEQLPLYVILEPLTTGTVRVVGVYDEGKINELDRFIAFLKTPLEKQ